MAGLALDLADLVLEALDVVARRGARRIGARLPPARPTGRLPPPLPASQLSPLQGVRLNRVRRKGILVATAATLARRRDVPRSLGSSARPGASPTRTRRASLMNNEAVAIQMDCSAAKSITGVGFGTDFLNLDPQALTDVRREWGRDPGVSFRKRQSHRLHDVHDRQGQVRGGLEAAPRGGDRQDQGQVPEPASTSSAAGSTPARGSSRALIPSTPRTRAKSPTTAGRQRPRASRRPP